MSRVSKVTDTPSLQLLVGPGLSSVYQAWKMHEPAHGRSIGLAEWPDYERLLSRTFTRLGWDPARFRVHRAALEHPVLHSIVWLRAARRT